jgi:hypothetical protein
LGRGKQLNAPFQKPEHLGYFFKKLKFNGKFLFSKNRISFNYSKLNYGRHNVNFFSLKKNNVIFLKYKDFDFFLLKFVFFSKNVKQFNKVWFTIQQQPKTGLFLKTNFNKTNLSFLKQINFFFKNSILVKNRLISVDNVLFLPARKNITVITNSFDVAHS